MSSKTPLTLLVVIIFLFLGFGLFISGQPPEITDVIGDVFSGAFDLMFRLIENDTSRAVITFLGFFALLLSVLKSAVDKTPLADQSRVISVSIALPSAVAIFYKTQNFMERFTWMLVGFGVLALFGPRILKFFSWIIGQGSGGEDYRRNAREDKEAENEVKKEKRKDTKLEDQIEDISDSTKDLDDIIDDQLDNVNKIKKLIKKVEEYRNNLRETTYTLNEVKLEKLRLSENDIEKLRGLENKYLEAIRKAANKIRIILEDEFKLEDKAYTKLKEINTELKQSISQVQKDIRRDFDLLKQRDRTSSVIEVQDKLEKDHKIIQRVRQYDNHLEKYLGFIKDVDHHLGRYENEIRGNTNEILETLRRLTQEQISREYFQNLNTAIEKIPSLVRRIKGLLSESDDSQHKMEKIARIVEKITDRKIHLLKKLKENIHEEKEINKEQEKQEERSAHI
ncbi:hypothetical protein GOV05_00800 [Candidatus Woesearchaeota archaeon]|nr:hypothetical protein [Candidatus Woesearchaeota archaeon]